MRVIKRLPLEEFWQKWPDAQQPLKDWYRLTKKASWRNFVQVKTTFGQTDLVKVQSGNTVAIFDIGGNKYRLIARISFEKQKVYVLRMLTHKEYDRGNWRTQL
jgi:mRNA interferase HigB